MATTLGGQTLRAPDNPVEGGRILVGTTERALNGTILRDYYTTKRRWSLKWTNLTTAERDTIMTEALDPTAQLFSPPDAAGTFTVLVDIDSISENPHQEADGIRYDISFTVEQQ